MFSSFFKALGYGLGRSFGFVLGTVILSFVGFQLFFYFTTGSLLSLGELYDFAKSNSEW